MSEGGGCCRWCVGFVFTLGLTSLFMWLSFRPSKPKLYITQFSVPALNKTGFPTPPQNPSSDISFELELENPNKDKGIYYDDVDLRLFYAAPNLSSSVANYTIPAFYQGHKKTAKKPGTAQGRGPFWENASASPSPPVLFKVRVETKVRYKILGFKTSHHGLNRTADVEVNAQGVKSYPKGIKLRSQGVSLRPRSYRAQWVTAGWFLVLLFVW